MRNFSYRLSLRKQMNSISNQEVCPGPSILSLSSSFNPTGHYSRLFPDPFSRVLGKCTDQVGENFINTECAVFQHLVSLNVHLLDNVQVFMNFWSLHINFWKLFHGKFLLVIPRIYSKSIVSHTHKHPRLLL